MFWLKDFENASAGRKVTLIAGLPRAQSARATEPHTHRLWSTSFPLVVTWLTERTYIRTYVRVYGLYGSGRGDYQKEGRGVSGVSCQVHIFYIGHSKIRSIDSCQNRIATDQYPMTISWAHVSTHWGDVIYFEAVRWPVNYFTRSRSMFSLILLATLLHEILATL